jgi:hypothetical protein
MKALEEHVKALEELEEEVWRVKRIDAQWTV